MCHGMDFLEVSLNGELGSAMEFWIMLWNEVFGSVEEWNVGAC